MLPQARTAHPDPLRCDGRELTLIVDPMADRLTLGDWVLGWQGDERLALYMDVRLGNWVLYRAEHDGVYRFCTTVPGSVRGIDAVGQLVQWLIDHDTQRGYDVLADLRAKDDARIKANEAKRTEWVGDVADRLRHGLVKDGVE